MKFEEMTRVTLAWLENLLDQGIKMSEDSISLASLASIISRIEGMLGSQRGSRSSSVPSKHEPFCLSCRDIEGPYVNLVQQQGDNGETCNPFQRKANIKHPNPF